MSFDMVSRVRWAYADWRRGLRLSWYRVDKAALAFLAFVIVVVTALGYALQSVIAFQDARKQRTRDFHRESLTCLAKNVYFEARGEPIAGQYAVAEVTMNRKASGLYPKTVCGVVYQQNWDPVRGRYVGAFSWTEFNTLPDPTGYEWQRAWAIAEAVYYHRYTPTLRGALHFHATYIKPEWAKERQRVSRIGRHVFYK